MLPKVLLAGVGVIAVALTILAVTNLNGVSYPGVSLLLEFLIFLALFPSLMGLFASPPPEEAGRRIAEREARERPW